MELGLQFEDIFFYEVSQRITSAHEESMETMIPEYCPDIARIVDAAGQLILREKLLNGEHCAISGSIKVTILYTSEEATGLRSLSVSVPFSCTLDDHALDKCGTICAEGRVLLTEARAVTSRKLYIKVLPEITVVGYRPVKHQLCCGTQEEKSVRIRCLRSEANLLTAISEKSFSFTQDTALDGDCAPGDVLLYRLYPTVLSVQRLGNKLMIKGEMGVWVLYRDEEQGLRQYEAVLPLSQILDAAELPENAEYQIRLQQRESDVRVLRTDSGNGFGITAKINACILAYGSHTMCYVADLYSTRFDAEVERQEIRLLLASPDHMVTQEAQLRLELGDREPFISITEIDCAPAEVLTDESGGQLRTTLHVRLLYLDESGAPVTTERTVEVSTGVNEISGPVTVCCGQAAVQVSGGVCLVRIPVTFQMENRGELTFDGITAVTLAETQNTDAPSLILCRMDPTETLWDVAKRYRTDEDAIRNANQMESGEAAERGMLLIPRIR